MNTVDAGALMAGARASEHSESFIVVAREADVTIGVGASFQAPDRFDFFIELSAPVCRPNRPFEVGILERWVAMLKAMAALGYGLECEKGAVTCQKSVPSGRIVEELAALQEIVRR